MPKTSNPYFQSLIIATAVVTVDQLSKAVAAQYGVVTLNTGVSFGLLGSNDQLVATAIFVGFAVLGILALQLYCKKYPLAIGLFLGGAVANLIDRFLFNGVRDWLPVVILPVKNNLADWAIFAAVVLLFISEWRRERRK